MTDRSLEPTVAALDARPTVGVDVGGTWSRVVVFDSAGGVLASSRRPTGSGPDELVADLLGDLRLIEAERGPLGSIGIGIPGLVTEDGSVSMAVNIGVRSPVALRSILAAEFGVPVAVENDVNCATVGALAQISDPKPRSFAFVSIGTGLACGLVLDGRLNRGVANSAGEIGHLPAPHASRLCACGRTGCIETVGSGSALSKRLAESGLPTRFSDLESLIEAGDATAETVLNEFFDGVSLACDIVDAMVEPEVVMLGGGVGSSFGDYGRNQIMQRLRSDPLRNHRQAAGRLVIADPDLELGAIGADLLARQLVELPK